MVFHPNLDLLARTLDSLGVAAHALRDAAGPCRVHLTLVDNGGAPPAEWLRARLAPHDIALGIASGHGNVGYGRGHNIAIDKADGNYHLILNPDVELAPDALLRAHEFFSRHADAGLLSPLIRGDDGEIQYLCRRYPTLLDLLARGFLPARLRALFARRLARYEMRESINERDIVWDPQIVSGCFMFFRTSVLHGVRGFDPRYFLYFEDYDLSLRTHDLARVAYVPDVRIVHHGGGAARKGWLHIRLFVTSALKFFSRFGWKLC